MNNEFPYADYLSWIKFKQLDIYKALAKYYIEPLTEINEEYEPTKEDVFEFCNEIWNEVLLTNQGISSKWLRECNYLLFTHKLILGSEFIFPSIYKSYEISNVMNSLGNVVSSVSDASTSVSSHVTKAAENLSFYDQLLMSTEFGLKYLLLLKQLQSINVIL